MLVHPQNASERTGRGDQSPFGASPAMDSDRWRKQVDLHASPMHTSREIAEPAPAKIPTYLGLHGRTDRDSQEWRFHTWRDPHSSKDAPRWRSFTTGHQSHPQPIHAQTAEGEQEYGSCSPSNRRVPQAVGRPMPSGCPPFLVGLLSPCGPPAARHSPSD